jgi:hypothetical protein
MRLLHYAAQPLPPALNARPQEIEMKPRGLWVSVEGNDDWPSWCVGENFALDSLSHVHEITLAENASILRLSTASEIAELTSDYACPLPGMPPHHYTRAYVMDWPRLAGQYDGLIIAPYMWSCRLDYLWYYGWDCASGCIWNPRAIAEHRLRPMLGVVT